MKAIEKISENKMEYYIDIIGEKDFNSLISLFKDFAVFEKLPEKMTNTAEQMIKEKSYFNGFTIKNRENHICGYVTFFFAYYTWTGKALYMDDLYICQDYRGQGLGTMLVNKVISFAKENQCHKLRWQVSNWNESAIRFYESLGAEINRVEMNCDLLL
jgi:GNAT superfamily N-acetyltransferase